MSQQEIADWSMSVTEATDLTPHPSNESLSLVSPDQSLDLDRNDPSLQPSQPQIPTPTTPTSATFYGIRAHVRALTPQVPHSFPPTHLSIGPWLPLSSNPAPARHTVLFTHPRPISGKCIPAPVPQNRWLRYVFADEKLWIDWGWSAKAYRDSEPRYFVRCKHTCPRPLVPSCESVREAEWEVKRMGGAEVLSELEKERGLGVCGCSIYPMLASEELRRIFEGAWKCGPALMVREPGEMNREGARLGVPGMRHSLCCRIKGKLPRWWRAMLCKGYDG